MASAQASDRAGLIAQPWGKRGTYRKRWSRAYARLLTAPSVREETRRRAVRMWSCRQYIAVIQADAQTQTYYYSCHHPLCPQCRSARGSRWIHKILPFLTENDGDGLTLDGRGRIWAPLTDGQVDAGIRAAGAQPRDGYQRKLRDLEGRLVRQPARRFFPLFLTLTIKNLPRLLESDERGQKNLLHQAIQESWRGMRETARRRPDSEAGRLWAQIAGGIKVVEITRNPDRKDWHPHIHCVVLARVSYIQADELAAVWERYADGHIVDIKAVRDPRRGMKELLKYLTKPVLAHHKGSDVKAGMQAMGSAEAEELATAIHRQRMVSTFGCLYGLPKTPATDETPTLTYAVAQIRVAYWASGMAEWAWVPGTQGTCWMPDNLAEAYHVRTRAHMTQDWDDMQDRELEAYAQGWGRPRPRNN